MTNDSSNIETGRSVILFDGVCGLCSGLVQFILIREKRGHFFFASLQSEYARELLRSYSKNPDELDTFYVVVNRHTSAEQLLARSDAAIHVLSKIGFPFSLIVISKILPRFLRDQVYSFVARNRYKWFGKQEFCMAPDPSIRQRFLD